jgi:ABC-type glutathione transport system ATPase component
VPATPGRSVKAAFRRLSAGRRTLIIAHWLSTVVDADQILVLEDGRVVEQGRYHQLLARGGHYAKMWERQQAAPRRRLARAAPCSAGSGPDRPCSKADRGAQLERPRLLPTSDLERASERASACGRARSCKAITPVSRCSSATPALRRARSAPPPSHRPAPRLRLAGQDNQARPPSGSTPA